MPWNRCSKLCSAIATASITAALTAVLPQAETLSAPRFSVVRASTLQGDLWPGDYNGDGITDLAGRSMTSSAVAVALGNGDGTFRSPRDIPAVGRVLLAADVNGDRRTDLVVGPRAFED